LGFNSAKQVSTSSLSFLVTGHEMTYKCIENRRSESSCAIGG
jgi:hypothetical protein